MDQRKRSQSYALARQIAAQQGMTLPTWGQTMQGYDKPHDITPRYVQNAFAGGLEAKRAEVVAEDRCWIRGCELQARKDDPDGLCLPHRTNVDSWKVKR